MTDTKKILLVEDDALIRNLYSRALEKEGFTIEQAENGTEGYSKMQQGGYDLVLLDIMLPGMNGVDILKKLKDIPSTTPNKKIVVLTNLDEEVVKDDGEAYGVTAYWVKNQIDVLRLADEVKKVLA
jgi:DNA-binding response OmpR family regulator